MENSVKLANRFSAFVIDGILISLLMTPYIFHPDLFYLYKIATYSFFEVVMIIVTMGLAIFLLINIYSLKTKGQTIGKMIVGIFIMDSKGGIPPLSISLGFRYLSMWSLLLICSLIVTLGYYYNLDLNRNFLSDILAPIAFVGLLIIVLDILLITGKSINIFMIIYLKLI